MICKQRRGNRNPQVAQTCHLRPPTLHAVTPPGAPGDTNAALNSSCPRGRRWSQSTEFLQVQRVALHTAFALLNLQDWLLYPEFFLPPSHPDTSGDVTALLGVASAPPGGHPRPKPQRWAITKPSSSVALCPTEFQCRVPPWMLQPKPSSRGVDDSTHGVPYQLCPQGTPVLRGPFTKTPLWHRASVAV